MKNCGLKFLLQRYSQSNVVPDVSSKLYHFHNLLCCIESLSNLSGKFSFANLLQATEYNVSKKTNLLWLEFVIYQHQANLLLRR